MLIIRDAQMRVLQDVRDRPFVDWLAARLAPHAPGTTGETLRRRIRAGLSRARAHALADPTAIAAFVTAMFQVSPTFDEHPVVEAALRSEVPEVAVRTVSTRVDAAGWDAWRAGPGARGWAAIELDEKT